MKCNHCEICRKAGSCMKGSHACFLKRQAAKDIMPVRWKAAARK